MAYLVVFEGGEGAGKTTQVKTLYGRLCQAGVSAKMLREPGGTPTGESIRDLVTVPREVLRVLGRHQNRNRPSPPSPDSQLLTPDLWSPLGPEAELLLFMAARAQLIQDVIAPLWSKDTVLICDRFIHSTVAYQGYGRGINLDVIASLNRLVTKGISPDLVVLLDVDIERGLNRKRRAAEINRFEEEDVSFHRRVSEGYRKMYEEDDGKGWLKIDAKLPKKEIAALVFERVMELQPAKSVARRGNNSNQSASQGQLSGVIA